MRICRTDPAKSRSDGEKSQEVYMMNISIIRVTALLSFMLLGNMSALADAPTEQLKSTIDGILQALSDPSMERDAKRQKITGIIDQRFNYEGMSQRTLAVNWKKSSKEQQQRFVELFAQLLAESYLGRIEAYTNEKVEFASEKVKDNRAIVDTFIVTASVDIPISYKLEKKGNDWLVYDVVIEEVSLVRSYNSSYKDIVMKSGMDGLLADMETKLNEMRNKAPEKTS
jgi:phospholipid transport system substrate-binding protein